MALNLEPLTDDSEMPFGMHKGKKMEDVPASYLLYLKGEGCSDQRVVDYIEENLQVLKKQANGR